MRVTRAAVTSTCSICERTLLMGKRAIRFAPNGGDEYVDVWTSALFAPKPPSSTDG